jgi:NADPH:quinone reductase
MMRALRFDKFGTPSVLQLVEVADPTPRDGFAMVRVTAASINPSDVKNLAGAMEGTVLPRTPGRDFAGVVQSGPSEWVGREVFGTGGDLGFTVDGSHAELLELPVAALTAKPARLSAADAASIGVTSLAAWLGLIDYAALQPGESVAIVGLGGVGTLVAQIARWRGASKIVGADRGAPAASSPAARSIDAFVTSDEHVTDAIRAATNGAGADVVFDTVGGVMFEAALLSLALKGRLVEISATGRTRVEFDLRDFYHNESRIIGVDTRKLDASASAALLTQMLPAFESGAIAAPPIEDQIVPLERAIDAYEKVAGGARARFVLAPDAR